MVIGLAASGCNTSASTVTTDSQIGELPVSPEGVWHDLELLALHENRHSLVHLFSRRHVVERVYGTDSGNPPGDLEANLLWLNQRDAELAAKTVEVAGYGEHVRDVLRRLLRRGTSMTYPPEYPPPGIRRDDDRIPVGPNRSILVIQYWRQATGVGEPLYLECEFVQEHREWKIDRITPDPFSVPAGGELAAILAEIPTSGRRPRPTPTPSPSE